MSTSPPRTSAHALDRIWRYGEPPPSSTADRLALRLGLALILWGRRRAERTDRAESARRSGAAESAERARDRAFEARSHAGPTW
jgi:hypothetical protein